MERIWQTPRYANRVQRDTADHHVAAGLGSCFVYSATYQLGGTTKQVANPGTGPEECSGTGDISDLYCQQKLRAQQR